jgi:hypothetical protein
MNPLHAFSRAAARRYLQSAVFVDDKIYEKRSGMPVEPIDLPKRKPVLVREPDEVTSRPENEEAVPSSEAEQPYHPKDLVSSFAREGIICALYEPPEGFSTSPDSEIFKLCERPDIIILDWDFSGDQGEKALNLISALVQQSLKEFPHHTRLMAIYTADQSLVAVSNKVADRLTRDGFQPQPDRSQCRLQTGATRLVVLGKNIARFGEDETQFTVQESQLANRLIDEFADMNSGILPSYALHGMAAVRRNSKRILDRFHGDMNGAFLLHRALSKGSEEAFDQLPALLAEELLAVIEDKHLDTGTVAAIVSDSVAHLGLRAPKKDWHNHSGIRIPATQALASEVLKQMLVAGAIDRPKYSWVREIDELPKDGFRGIDPQLMEDLISVVDTEASGSNERLASLFATRTHYHATRRELLYGTIVRNRTSSDPNSRWSYSFCLMPLCDCLRLDQTSQFRERHPIRFPFWRLREDVFSRSGNSRRGISLALADGSYVSVSAGGRARDMLWIADFNVDDTTGTIAAVANATTGFTFTTAENCVIEWVAQLKPLHAQRIAHDIGLSISRVGLVEAEWLRLLCDR